MHSIVDLKEAEQEWRNHALLDHENLKLDPNIEADIYWKSVFALRNAASQEVFGNLKKVLTLLLVLPFSNASVERVFSVLNNMKTHNRNKLSTEMIVSLLLTKEGIKIQGGLEKFVPNLKMLQAKLW